MFEGKSNQSNANVIYSVVIPTGASTSTPLQLTTGTADWDPAVSSDGTHIAFARNQQIYGTENVAVVGIAGESPSSPATILTADNESWGPMYLGSKILYLSWRAEIIFDNIYLMNGDGSNVTRITNTPYETCFNLWEFQQ